MRYDLIFELGLFFATFIINDADTKGHELDECKWHPKHLSMHQALNQLSKYQVYAHYQAIL